MVDGGDKIVGLRYNRKDTPVPVVVIRSKAGGTDAIREAARGLGLPIDTDGALAATLAKKYQPGDFLKPEDFPGVARILVQRGLVG